MHALPQIILSSFDIARLESLIERLPPAQAEQLEGLLGELERAEVREPEEMPNNVVTMNSRVRFSTEGSDEIRELTLCYPKDADGSFEKVSILAPIGSALLGLSVGQEIEWKMPNGRPKKLRIEEVVYQPERSGDFGS